MASRPSNTTCKYSYKKCPNQRTTKRNGTLHTLCEYHRVKANTLQQVYAKKKKDGLASQSPASTGKTADDVFPPWLEKMDFSKTEFMTDEDCAILNELFRQPPVNYNIILI